MTQLKHAWWLLVALLLIGLALVPFAEAVNCNDVLGPGGTFALTADLTCETPVGVTVIDGAVLDLQGHTLTVTAIGGGIAVALGGTGATVRNGSVSAVSMGVYVAGEGRHRVSNIDMPFFQQAPAGIQVVSDGNLIVSNASQSRGIGIWVQGHRNRIMRNLVSGQWGIYVQGDYNRIVGNVGHHELIDMADAHADCAHNLWRANEFDSSRSGVELVGPQPGEIANPPCIGQSVDLPGLLAKQPN